MYAESHDDEYFGPLFHHGIEIEGYYVSTHGTIIGKNGRPLTWSSDKYPKVKIRLPKKDFSFYSDDQSGSATTTGQMIPVHILVANTHMPFRDNLPKVWTGYTEINGVAYKLWDLMSSEQQAVLRSCYQVDHIDGNKQNAHVSNLRYLSPVENSRAYYFNGESSIK